MRNSSSAPATLLRSPAGNPTPGSIPPTTPSRCCGCWYPPPAADGRTAVTAKVATRRNAQIQQDERKPSASSTGGSMNRNNVFLSLALAAALAAALGLSACAAAGQRAGEAASGPAGETAAPAQQESGAAATTASSAASALPSPAPSASATPVPAAPTATASAVAGVK